MAEFDTPVLEGYRVYRDSDPVIQPATSTLLAETGPGITSYVDNDATVDTKYYYTVVASYDYGQSAKSNEISIGGVGLNDPSSDQIQIFPNPVEGIVSIQTTIEGVYRIEIISLKGQLLHSSKFFDPSVQLDLSSYPAGTYLINIRSKDVVFTGKICKL